MDPKTRSQHIKEACNRKWNNRKDTVRHSKNNLILTYDSPPDYIISKEGEVVGVDAWVKLHDQNGREIPVDPHRRIVNPPTFHMGEYDPLSAFMETVWDSVVQVPNPKGWKTKGTVDTVFPTLDGRLDSQSTGSNYSTAREGTGTIQVTTSTATTAIGQFVQSTYSCYEQFWSFFTGSVIPDTDDIQSVLLQLWMVNDVSNTDFIVEIREKNFGGTLDTTDYVPGSQLDTYTLMASINTSGIGSSGAYKNMVSEAAFVNATNIKTGTVYLFGSSSRHRLNNTPPSDEYIQFAQRTTSGTTNDPKLTITHAAVDFEGWGYPL